MDNYIQGIVKEYHDQHHELQASQQKLVATETGLQEMTQMKNAFEKEVSGYKERCQALETDLRAKTGGNSDSNQ